jgi:molybdopterin-dependent oxidoreductase alpha subunit
MSQDEIEGVEAYDNPAGGWGALKATAQALARSRNALSGTGLLLKQNQPDGFDCPGCAWPDPKHTSSFEFCENGAKAVSWEATSKRVTPEFFAQHTVSELWRKSDHWLEDQGRLTHPMAYDRASDRYVEVSWDEAFSRIAKVLKSLPSPDLADFYTSGRASNEAAFLYQLFVRLYGTNNFPDCSNMCHEPSSVGLPRVIGIGKGTVTIEDFDKADMLFCIGHNPGTNHPRMMTQLRDASRRGAPIIVLNPFRERALERFMAPQQPVEMLTLSATPIGTQYHQVKIGGDAAALKGVMKALLELDDMAQQSGQARVIDVDFIREHTHGFEPFCEDLRAASWDAIVAACGLQRQALEGIAQLYARAERPIVCYGMGITQHRSGTANVEQIVALLLMRGAIGREGAGICPLRGHSNVQGDRTVGISERPPAAFLDKLGQVFGFEPPRQHGRSVVETLAAMREGRCKALVSLGGNLAVAAPDTQASFEGFRKLQLNVGIATKLNRTHLLTGTGEAFILPCLGRTELDVQAGGPQSVTVEDSMSMVHASRGFVKPASPLLRSEPAIVAGIAKATLGPTPTVDWDALVANYDLIRDKIEVTIPELFRAYNEKIREPGGFRLYNSASERVWKTPTGKANFVPFQGLEEDERFADPRVLRLSTMRSHDQYNTTIYSLNDRYRSMFGRRDVVYMNNQDIARAGVRAGAVVDIQAVHSSSAGMQRVLKGLTVVDYPLPEGCCGAYYPEANCLVGLDEYDPDALTPSYKSVPVRIVPSDGAAAAGGFRVTTEGLSGGDFEAA